MDYYESLIIGLFIIVPAIVGWLRFSNINSVFYPFLILIWINTLNEVFSSIIMQFGYYNTVNFNIWLLVDAYIFLWLFKKWNVFERSKRLYKSLWVLFSIVWTLETIFLSKLTLGFNSYFRILYCFIVVLMSINTINYLLLRERRSLIKNSMFIISCTFVIFYTITVLAETFFASNLKLGDNFRINIDHIVIFASLICNLIYTLAILWMPKKQAFILQY